MTAEKLTKNQRREQAREQARQAREAEKKREKRNRFFLQGGVALGIVAVLAIVGLVIAQSVKPAGPGPLNMASGGATFGADLAVVQTPALQSGEEREARATDYTTAPPIDVEVYVDYMCPYCAQFEQEYGDMLETFTGSGDINLTVYPINFLDAQSVGSKYSTRAANLFSCVVDQQPDAGFALNNLLLSEDVQPAEGTTGLTDDQLLEQAEAAGAELTTELKQCVKDQRFASFISGNWTAVSEGAGILGLAEGAQLVDNPQTGTMQEAGEPQLLRSTPTIIVNGQQWVQGRDSDLEAHILKLISELGGDTATSEETPAE